MPRKLDPAIGDVLKQYGYGADAVWDCHGTWVVYHKVLEQIAVKANIVFDMPIIIQADVAQGIASCCVRGEMGDLSQWSIGEASPKNNKNAYPWAMAEKRAKDRVILKLIGLHGLAFSEEEADAFQDAKPKDNDPKPVSPHPEEEERLDWDDILPEVQPSEELLARKTAEKREVYKALVSAMGMAQTEAELFDWAHKNAEELWAQPDTGRHYLREKFETLRENL